MRKVMVAAVAALFTISGAAALSADKKGTDSALAAAVAGDWRSEQNKARDKYRHPAESLAFWGLKPGMTILEIQPGGGWWTEILAPYARMTDGKYYATGKAGSAFETKFGARPEIFGKIQLVDWGAKSPPPPANTFDFILSARSVHGWARNDMADKAFRDFFHALKPGGILAIEQHRAKPGKQDPKFASGYVTEEFVIEQAKKAGFVLAGRSEINANPRDTADHPFGVWTLPPTRATVPYGSGKEPDPTFDRAKYDAIGESDRMTLKFQKPRG